MKVKDLLEHIQEAKNEYGKGVLNWTIALEQHPGYKRCSNCNKSEDYIVNDNLYGNEDETIFIKSHAIGCVRFIKEKVLGIQIHY